MVIIRAETRDQADGGDARRVNTRTAHYLW